MKILYITRCNVDHPIVFGNDVVNQIQSEGHFLFNLNDYCNKYKQNQWQSILRDIITYKNIDLTIWSLGVASYELNPIFLNSLRKHTTVALLSAGDCEHMFESSSQYYGQTVDFVLSFSLAAVHKYREIGIPAYYFTNYFDTNKYKKYDVTQLMGGGLAQNLNKKYDVTFVGSINKPKRQEYIQHLRNNGINVEIFGSGSKNGSLTHKEMIKVFNQSKINLNFTMIDEYTLVTKEFKVNQRRRQPKGRPIEISMCGSFVLSEYAYGMEEIFKNKSLDMFDDKEELLNLCKYYLEKDDEREKKAKELYEYSKHRYSLKNFIPDLLVVYNEFKLNKYKNSDKLIIDHTFKRNYSTYHLLTFFYLLVRKPKIAFSELLIFFKYPIINIFYFLYILKQMFLIFTINFVPLKLKKLIRGIIRRRSV